MFYVKYLGEDNGVYHFQYEGSYYTYGYARGEVEINENTSSTSGKVNMEMRMVWVNYDGHFDLVKVEEKSFWGDEKSYYGISNLSLHIYTKEPLDISVNISMSGTSMYGEISTNIEYVLKGTFDVSADVSFEDPIPYIPINTTSEYIGTTANYVGKWKIDTIGHSKLSTNMGSNNMSGGVNLRVSLDKHVNDDFSGSTHVSADMVVSDGKVHRTGVLENLLIGYLNIFPQVNPFGTSGEGLSFDNYLSTAISISNAAEYSRSEGFYTAITLSDGHFGFTAVSTEESEPATEEEVKAVESDAPAEYGSYSSGLLDFIMASWIYILVGIAAILGVAAAVIFLRTKK
jgi:hypothetical protein